MFDRIQLLRNVGQFDNVSPPQQFAPLTPIYGENGRGKTTIAKVLRSLATNDPVLVTDRQRLGSQHPPHVIISHTAGNAIFQNGTWNRHLPEITIFDDAFVSDNVCSGIEIQAAHRQSLHELILGARGVALSTTLRTHVQRIEEHSAALRELADEIPAAARGPYKVDPFCALAQDQAIDAKIQEAERRLAAARSSDAIRQRPGFWNLAFRILILMPLTKFWSVVCRTSKRKRRRAFRHILRNWAEAARTG